MAESPDFEELAGEIIAAVVIERNRLDEVRGLSDAAAPDAGARRRVGTGTVPAIVAAQLRLVWNARGAADLVIIDTVRRDMAAWLACASSGVGSENVADEAIARWRDALTVTPLDR